jgi:predicted nicotinamide N-methyase
MDVSAATCAELDAALADDTRFATVAVTLVGGAVLAVEPYTNHDAQVSWAPVMVFARQRNAAASGDCRPDAPRGAHMMLQTDTIPQVLWPAAAPMAHFIASAAPSFAGRRVVELGSGAGLCGLVAARVGAECVALTDCSPTAIAMLHRSVAANNDLAPRLHVDTLRWGHDDDADRLLATVDGLWPRPKDRPAVDIVIGSDIFYFGSSLKHGLATAKRLFNGNGVFWCGSVARSDRMEADLEDVPAQLGFQGGCVLSAEPFMLFRWTWSCERLS